MSHSSQTETVVELPPFCSRSMIMLQARMEEKGKTDDCKQQHKVWSVSASLLILLRCGKRGGTKF